MNDQMASVPDIPGDADDDLSEISPELVLVDPELARVARERVPAISSADRLLRLVSTVEAARDANDDTRHPAATRADAGENRERLRREHPEPIVPRTLATEPPPTSSPQMRAPARDDAADEHSRAESALIPTAPDEVAAPTAMPHPIARPVVRPPAPAARRPRGRGVLTLLVGICVASVATLWLLGLTGDSSPVASETARVPIVPAAPKPRPSAHQALPARKTPLTRARSEETQMPTNVPRVVRWAPVRGAVAYRVQLFRNGRQVLGVRTTRTALDLERLLRIRGLRMAPGNYGWSVQPIPRRGKSR